MNRVTEFVRTACSPPDFERCALQIQVTYICSTVGIRTRNCHNPHQTRYSSGWPAECAEFELGTSIKSKTRHRLVNLYSGRDSRREPPSELESATAEPTRWMLKQGCRPASCKATDKGRATGSGVHESWESRRQYEPHVSLSLDNSSTVMSS
jgi:hypothetical protein